MAKDPAFLFYPNDYIGGTMGMTFEEKGAYIELLMMQFNRGHMSGHMCGQVVGQLWDKIQDKFQQDENGLWFNERLEVEQNKRKVFTISRKTNLKGVNQYTKKETINRGHMTSHMENENKDINIYYIDEKDFLNDWKIVREKYTGKQTNLNKLNFKEQNDFQGLQSEFSKEQFRNSMIGLFRQKDMFESNQLRPAHFLSDRNIEKYLDTFNNKTQLFNKEKQMS